MSEWLAGAVTWTDIIISTVVFLLGYWMGFNKGVRATWARYESRILRKM